MSQRTTAVEVFRRSASTGKPHGAKRPHYSLGLAEFLSAVDDAVELLERWQRDFSRRPTLIVLPESRDRRRISRLLEQVNRDFDRAILDLRKKKRLAERMLKRLRFATRTPGRPQRSNLARDIIAEQIAFSSQNPGKKLSYRQIAKRLAPDYGVDWNDLKTNENGNTPQDLLVMRVKKTFKR